MVAPTKIESKVTAGLKVLSADVGDLDELSAEWNTLDDGEQVSWSMDWDHVIGTYLPLLDEAYRTGHMTAEQARLYRASLSRLAAALPILDRLNLSRPPFPLGGG